MSAFTSVRQHTHVIVLNFFFVNTSRQRALLDSNVWDLNAQLAPGVQRLNWNSLGIDDYISNLEHVRNTILVLVNETAQVQSAEALVLKHRLNLALC